nr:hypothetical protein Iba_chr01dCG8820 [Ipomoea batatas]GMC69263.1 hypothetical protein Iba_chr03aCG5040 [Ipomoea batatas]GMD22316.1 hypothetical protein Iba_chr08aCG9660 [Ipomoea batatas]GMD27140.1 hypothetical protein Iba_chr08dCG10940 [Ipomoea batatas]GMD63675.1 hypothetical protein Iba_chr12bCG17140 [Ipomoea batatas]
MTAAIFNGCCSLFEFSVVSSEKQSDAWLLEMLCCLFKVDVALNN